MMLHVTYYDNTNEVPCKLLPGQCALVLEGGTQTSDAEVAVIPPKNRAKGHTGPINYAQRKHGGVLLPTTFPVAVVPNV
jgi:hypothetical protein